MITCSLSKNKLSLLNLSAVSSMCSSGSLGASWCSRLSTDSMFENNSLSGDSTSGDCLLLNVSKKVLLRNKIYDFEDSNTYGLSLEFIVLILLFSTAPSDGPSFTLISSLTIPVCRCSIRSKACSWISTFRWVIILTNIRMSFAAHI